MEFSLADIDLDYEPLFSILDEQEETDNALKKLTDWDFDEDEDSFEDEDDLFPIRDYKNLGSNIFETSTPLKTSANCSRAGSSDREQYDTGQTQKTNDRFTFPNKGLRTENSPSPIYGSLERGQGSQLANDEKPVIYDLPILRKPQLTPQTKEVFSHDSNKVKVQSSGSGQHLSSGARGISTNGSNGYGHSSLNGSVQARSSQPCSSFGNQTTFQLPARRSSLQSNFSGLGTPTGSLQKKRVKAVCDVDDSVDPSDYPNYHINPESVASFSFPSSTWDTMMRNLCIALESNGVFMCDQFLGTTLAEGLWNELEYMKGCGTFERLIQRPAKSFQRNYACVFLQEEERLHRRVDGLVLMMFKLASYFSTRWKKASVQLSHFPAGQPAQGSGTASRDKRGTLLKCIYFPNRQIGLHPDEAVLKITTSSKVFKINPVFDRMVAFWGDALEHEVSSSHTESYLVTLWLQRL